MAIKIYEYAGCSTCRNALKYLDAKKKKYEKVGIVEQPPTVSELKAMLGYLKASGKTFKNLFNTSGEQYRALKIGDRIKAGMTEQDAIALLSGSCGPFPEREREMGAGWGHTSTKNRRRQHAVADPSGRHLCRSRRSRVVCGG